MDISDQKLETKNIRLQNGEILQVSNYNDYLNLKSYTFYAKKYEWGYIKFSEDWSKTPGGKSDALSCFNTIVQSEIDRIKKMHKTTKVNFIFNFDDCFGFPHTFLDELFGKKLMKYYNYINLIIVSFDEVVLYDDIIKIIEQNSQCE